MALSLVERVRNRRNTLRAAGLRPVQIWVPDTRRADFAAECHRQSRMLRGDAQETDTLNFWNAAADTDGWE